MRRRVLTHPAHVSAMLFLLTATFAPSFAPSFAEGKHVMAQGRVVASSGEPLAGWPVQLIGTQRYIELKRFSSGGDVVTAARVTTDINGYYSIDVPKDRHFQFWFLRFAEPGRLDTVRFVIPEDFEITSDARRGRVAGVDRTIQIQTDWPEVQRRIADAGGESTEKGKILRALGLPEKSVRDDAAGSEEWWYFTKGVVYTFHGAEPAGERRFEPVKAPSQAVAGGASR